MTQPNLTEKQQQKLEAIHQFAQKTEEKLHKLDQMTAKIAEKWKQRQEEKKII